ISGRSAGALAEPRFERQAGKVYLVGRQLADPRFPNWMDGALHYVPREQIAFYTVFASVEDYLARLSAPAPAPTPAAAPRRGWFDRGPGGGPALGPKSRTIASPPPAP